MKKTVEEKRSSEEMEWTCFGGSEDLREGEKENKEREEEKVRK